MPDYKWPKFGPNRGKGFWSGVFGVANIWKSRRKVFRVDKSIAWRAALEARIPPTPDRSVLLSKVIPDVSRPFRIILIGDTGEGDSSQYCLVPLIRAVQPDLMIINGDIAYPAGEMDDFKEGFFGPYHDLGIPIWATPGNHEYYADSACDPFHFIFCDPQSADLWESAGLRQVPQPGFYWELRDRTGSTPLVILGVDSGQSANLDGHDTLFSKHSADREQHAWLEGRLDLADADGSKVIVLFHIPGLVDSKKDGVHLEALHRIIAAHPSVKLVCCGHIHNHQQYSPAVFAQYMAEVCGATPAPGMSARYIVSGNGGATIERARSKGPYPPEAVFPTDAQWAEYAGMATKVADAVAHGSAIAEHIAKHGKPKEDDPRKLQSFVMLEVLGSSIDVIHVHLDDLDRLYPAEPPNLPVDINLNQPPPDPVAVGLCIHAPVHPLSMALIPAVSVGSRCGDWRKADSVS